MKPTLCIVPAVFFVLTTACGPDLQDLPPVDEAACTKENLEADGRDSSELGLPPGTYVISSTYLRLRHSRAALARFRELNAPMADTLAANPGVVKVVTRLSVACNTARTLSAYKDEAAMYDFVGSPAHAAAVAAVGEVSRGGSIVTHWTDTEAGYSWQTATAKLAVKAGPLY